VETVYSSTNPPIDLPRFWQRRTRGVRRFVNAAWVVESILPNLFLASLVVTAAILVARRQGWNDRLIAAIGLLLGLAAIGAAYVRARRHFISETDARARIESGLRLHTRLSAAAAGVGSWPEADRWRPALWRWHWRKLAVLPLGSAALLLAALLLPIVPNAGDHAKPPVAKPPALEKVETMLEQLAATPAIEPASIEAVQREAQELAKQDPADWYSHASLEAADHLKSKLESGMKTLGDNAAKLEKLLGRNPAEAGADWNEKLQGALGALQGNVPGLNSDLAKALAGLDPSKMLALSPEQLEQLKEALAEAKKAAGKGQPGDQGDGEGEETEEGENAADPGVSRGPGTAPVKLASTPTDLGTKKTEAVPSEDLRHAALGDALGMSAGQHEVDKSKQHRAADGGAASAGEGAGAVWQQQHVTPEERKRLQQFFQ
jgi:hypothetical protein